MKTVALVPIKLNSERVKDKNIRTFYDGKPLIHFILESLKQCEAIDEIYVYCSNKKIQEYLIEGVKFIKRPIFLDSNSSNCNDIINEFIKEVDADYYVVSHATAPFTKPVTIEKCIKDVKTKAYDSAFSVEKIQTFLWEKGKAINFDINRFPRTQDLEPIYKETSGAFVFPKETFLKYKRRVGVNPSLIEIESPYEGIDIDTEYDMKIAQLVYKDIKENI